MIFFLFHKRFREYFWIEAYSIHKSWKSRFLGVGGGTRNEDRMTWKDMKLQELKLPFLENLSLLKLELTVYSFSVE